METFVKCASVLNKGFSEWTIKRKRGKLSEILERYVELHQPYTTINTCFI